MTSDVRARQLASAINAAGPIVGGERDWIGDTRAILWDGADVRPPMSRWRFLARDRINDAGQVLIANESGPPALRNKVVDQGRTTLVGDFDATALMRPHCGRLWRHTVSRGTASLFATGHSSGGRRPRRGRTARAINGSGLLSARVRHLVVRTTRSCGMAAS